LQHPAVAYLVLVRSMRLVTLTILICSGLTSASQIVFDDGKLPSKQRSPELEALNFMTGKWNDEFTIRETSWSKEVKLKGVTITQWSPNGLYLISDGWAQFPPPVGFTRKAWANKITVITWDPIKKEYRVTDIANSLTSTAIMSMNRNGGTIHGESRNGDHVTKSTMTFERVSDTETKYHIESSVDDGPQWVYLEGTSRKVSD
jgi:hypothetical protein